MSTATVFALASGGWLVVGPNGKTSIVSPLPTMTGQPAAELAKALRDWADDIERIASEAADAILSRVRIVDLISGEIEQSTLEDFFLAYELTALESDECERGLKEQGAWEFGNAGIGRKRVEVMA